MSEEIPAITTGEQILLPETPSEPAAAITIAASENITQPLPALIPSRKYALLTLGSLALAFLLGGTATFSLLTTTTTRSLAIASTSKQTAAATSAVPVPDAFASVQLQAQSAYVYDLKTHQVLYMLNPDSERPLASLTKIAMALAVTEVLPQDSRITIPYNTATPNSAEILPKKSVWKVQQVLDFTLIASSNQGADILASAANDALHAKYPLSPSVGATVWRMNDIAKGLGLSSMIFSNDNGLDLSPTQSGAYGSARDVGMLVAYAASTSLSVFDATTKSSMSFKNDAGVTATAFNTDTALGAIPGIIMGKTGYTDLAGGNLAIVFDAGIGHPVVAVVMGSTEEGRFTDMKQLVSAAIASISSGR